MCAAAPTLQLLVKIAKAAIVFAGTVVSIMQPLPAHSGVHCCIDSTKGQLLLAKAAACPLVSNNVG